MLRSSMLVAVFNELLALRCQRELDEVTGEVAGMVVVPALLPLIVGFVLA